MSARFDTTHAHQPTYSAAPPERLLSAASAPPYPDELAGEDEAVQAFLLARTTYASRPYPVHHRAARPSWAWALVAKLAGALLATAGASWALAAGTGLVPAPWDSEDPPATSTTSQPTSPATPGGTSVRPTSGGAPTPSGAALTPSPDAGTPEPSDTPQPSAGASTPPAADPSLHGLCQSFMARGGDVESLSDPVFARLVQAAGGAEEVPAFCAALLSPSPSPSPTAT